MAEIRKPGRPRVGEQQVGRERIVEGVIEYVRAGHSDISRREISAYLGITPALITYYFPKGFSLLTEAVDRQSIRWRHKLDDLCEQREASSQVFDSLQHLIITMYKADAHIVDLQTSLWRAGHMPYFLVDEMKRKASMLLMSGERTQVKRNMAMITMSIIWGACEHCVRDHSDGFQTNIFNSEALASGRLVVACWAPKTALITEDA